MNIQGFYTGREFDADTFFGAHPYEGGTHFAVWAPSARDVKVITSGLSDGSWAEWQCTAAIPAAGRQTLPG